MYYAVSTFEGPARLGVSCIMEGSRYSSGGAAIPHAVRLGPRIAYARAWHRPPLGAAETVEAGLGGTGGRQ